MASKCANTYESWLQPNSVVFNACLVAAGAAAEPEATSGRLFSSTFQCKFCRCSKYPFLLATPLQSTCSTKPHFHCCTCLRRHSGGQSAPYQPQISLLQSGRQMLHRCAGDISVSGRHSAHISAAELAAHSSYFSAMFASMDGSATAMNDIRQLLVPTTRSQEHLHTLVEVLIGLPCPHCCSANTRDCVLSLFAMVSCGLYQSTAFSISLVEFLSAAIAEMLTHYFCSWCSDS